MPPDASAAISPGGPAVGLTIGTPGQNGAATFTGTAGQRISLKVASTVSQSDLSILNPDGTTLASATGFGTSGTFVDTRTLPQGGTYTIVANPRSSYTGAFTLTLYGVPPDASATISPGGPAVGLTIGTPGQNGAATFTGTAGQRISLKVASTVSQSDLSILNPDGTTLASASGFGTSGTFVDTRTLPQGGTYTIVANPRSSYTGAFTLTLYERAAPTRARPSTPGRAGRRRLTIGTARPERGGHLRPGRPARPARH